MAPDEGVGSGGADEALRRLEQRLERASEAAERLMAEATQSAARTVAGAARAATGSGAPGSAPGEGEPGGPPPSGWQVPGAEGGDGGRGDLELLAQVFQSLRDLIPAELERRLAEALRELLLALRALIDWYLERTERRKAAPSEVQDIPIA